MARHAIVIEVSTTVGPSRRGVERSARPMSRCANPPRPRRGRGPRRPRPGFSSPRPRWSGPERSSTLPPSGSGMGAVVSELPAPGARTGLSGPSARTSAFRRGFLLAPPPCDPLTKICCKVGIIVSRLYMVMALTVGRVPYLMPRVTAEIPDRTLLIVDEDKPFLPRFANAHGERGVDGRRPSRCRGSGEVARSRHGFRLVDMRSATAVGRRDLRAQGAPPRCAGILLTGYGNMRRCEAVRRCGRLSGKPADADDVVRRTAGPGRKRSRPETDVGDGALGTFQRVYELCGRNVSETARRLSMPGARCSAPRQGRRRADASAATRSLSARTLSGR